MQDPVITALEAALSQNRSVGLQLALGDRWLSLGDAARALDAYAAALAIDPASVEALGKAADAAESCGSVTRAMGYRRLLEALGSPQAPASQAPTRLHMLRPEETPPAASAPRATAPRQSPDGWLDQEPPANVLQLVKDNPETSGVNFSHVGGLEPVKRRIDLAFLAPLRDPALFAAYGKAIRGGLLLFGPPGCGKTHLARATAGEVGARFTSIGLTDVLDMWIGESEKHLHELFETARRQAPTVLFFDEIDALGQKRSQLRHTAGRNLVNQLLVELDGLDSGSGVYVLAATNHPWDVDPALKRPGRFDRTVWVPPPDATARASILSRHMQGRPVEGLDYELLAARTEGLSGADLVHLADTAVEYALEEALASGTRRRIGMADFERASREVKTSVGPWLETARNYALYANEAGQYDELAAWLKGRR